jgi:hypothetical protein
MERSIFVVLDKSLVCFRQVDVEVAAAVACRRLHPEVALNITLAI